MNGEDKICSSNGRSHKIIEISELTFRIDHY